VILKTKEKRQQAKRKKREEKENTSPPPCHLVPCTVKYKEIPFSFSVSKPVLMARRNRVKSFKKNWKSGSSMIQWKMLVGCRRKERGLH